MLILPRVSMMKPARQVTAETLARVRLLSRILAVGFAVAGAVCLALGEWRGAVCCWVGAAVLWSCAP